MKHCVAAVAVSLTVGLAGCDEGIQSSKESGQLAATTTEPVPPPSAPTDTSPQVSQASQAGQAIKGAPRFVDLYPGAQVVSTNGPSTAQQLTFTTDAPPDTVIAYYKQRAESSGLHPTAAMNQGPARAYGASDRHEAGASLQVVASPTEDGLTSVQLNWSDQS